MGGVEGPCPSAHPHAQLPLARCVPATVNMKGACVQAAEPGLRHLHTGAAVGLWCLGHGRAVVAGCLGELRLSVAVESLAEGCCWPLRSELAMSTRWAAPGMGLV